jgi:probable rRNA maturation factor
MSDCSIDIVNETGDESLPATKLVEAAQKTLQYEGVERTASLSLLLTGDEELQRLNRQFRGEDKPTDVLSFPAGETAGATLGELGEYLGDIAISVPTALRQAQQGGHKLEAELLLLTVHGVLHLLGHDHATEVEREKMWGAQGEILMQLGVDAGIVLGESTTE